MKSPISRPGPHRNQDSAPAGRAERWAWLCTSHPKAGETGGSCPQHTTAQHTPHHTHTTAHHTAHCTTPHHTTPHAGWLDIVREGQAVTPATPCSQIHSSASGGGHNSLGSVPAQGRSHWSPDFGVPRPVPICVHSLLPPLTSRAWTPCPPATGSHSPSAPRGCWSLLGRRPGGRKGGGPGALPWPAAAGGHTVQDRVRVACAGN